MTYQDDYTLPTELLKQVAEQGLDFRRGNLPWTPTTKIGK